MPDPQRQQKRKRTRITPLNKNARRRAASGLNKQEDEPEERQIAPPPTESDFVTWSMYRSFVGTSLLFVRWLLGTDATSQVGLNLI